MNSSNSQKIAIVTPKIPGKSETFIKAHIDNLCPDGIFFHDGLIPQYATGKRLQSRIYRIGRKAIGLLLNDKTYHDRIAFENYLVKNKYNVVLAEYGVMGATIFESCKRIDIPLIIHFHGYDASIHTLLERYGPAYRQMFATAKAVLSVSNIMTDMLVENGCPKEKIVYNPYGPNEDYFKIDRTRKKEIQFCSVGRFAEKKSPLSTIRAFRKVVDKFPNAKLKMIGDGDLLPKAKLLAEELRLSAEIAFLGGKSKPDIMSLFEESFCFVQHSVRAENGDMEGSPVAIMEAAASGLPIIATRHAGIPETVLDGQTGYLVDENDIQGMADRMILMAQQPEKAFSMGLAGRQHIRNNFSIEKHLNVLKEALIVQRKD